MNVDRKIASLLAVACIVITGAWDARGQAPPPSLPVTGGSWVAQGPAPTLNGQLEGVTNRPVSGAVNVVVPHPTNADIAWIAAVNGGIWKTTNATNASPTWTQQTDGLSSLSFGALSRDPTDATANTLVGGFGRSSSFGGRGGPRSGIVRTTNGGTNWTELGPGALVGKNINGIAGRGATIVVSVDFAESFTCNNIGIFRSTTTGGSFSIVSGAVGSGLPLGRAFDLAGDPSNSAILYTVIKDASACGGVNGVYKSTNTGATWTKVSNSTMDALMATDSTFSNARIAVGASGQIYAGIIVSGALAGLFRSGTGGSSWTQLDTPTTIEAGSPIGIHPGAKPGTQGGVHFSIAADPTDANIVYVGGDRQPDPFPNSIGSLNYAGRLFRVNAGAGAGSQATSLTNCQTATAACNSTISTSSNSSPHADSRRLAVDANGNLLEADDGGVYRRTNPKTTGDWFSVNGNLSVTEMHNVAYDRVSNMIIGGNQDTGTSEQTTVGGTTWNQVTQGDGGDVAVDDTSSATQSRRYSSYQFLGGLRRRIVNTSGVTTAQDLPALIVVSGPPLEPQFYTPIESNIVDPARMLFAADNDLYESLDRGETITALGLNLPVTAMAFGGRVGVVDNVNLIYAISGSSVYVRTAGAGAPTLTATSPGASFLVDIAIDPNDWQKAYVINSGGQVYTTANAGGIWTNITGNLGSGTTSLSSIVFIAGNPNAIAVGGVNGVFRMATNNPGVWNQFGSGMSNAPVYDMDYDVFDDTLVATAIGRGTWKLTPAGNLGPLPTLSINDVSVTEGNAGTTNAVFTVTLTPASAGTVNVSYATSNGTATDGNNTLTNASAITIPSGGNASPYPSTIVVSGLTGTITQVKAKLTGFSHTYTQDVDVLLVGPGGQSVVLMSDVGSSSESINIDLTFDDSGAALPPDSLTTGTYQPTNLNDGEGGDVYSPPAPGSGYGAALSVFNATSPNGTWSLYVVDDVGLDDGTISSWTLTITTGNGDYVSTSGMLTFTPGVTSQPISVTVNGDATNESSETFFVDLSLASNAAILDGQGIGTITNDDGGLLPPTNVVATASAATNVNITWIAAAGATSYRVYRNSGAGYTLVGSPSGTSHPDATVVANTAYLYKVRSFSGSESSDSNIDIATTVLFTDPTLTVGTTEAKLAHFTELLTAVNAVRTLAALGGIAFTAPTPTTSVTVRRQHVLDLRTGLDAARSALALSALTYTDPTITAGTTTIKAAHISDLRNGVK